MDNFISVSEQFFLENGIEQGIRNDGRDIFDFRIPLVELGVITSANGSARIRNDEVDILTTIKCEVSSPTKNPTWGDIIINIDCPINDKNDEDYTLDLSNTIKDLCFNNFDLSKLCILSNYLCWNIFIDIMIISNGGNILDWLVFSIHCALRNSRIPQVTAKVEIEDGEEKSNLQVNPLIEEGIPFPIKGIPLVITAGYIRNKIVWDMNIQEEACAKAIIAISVDEYGHCCGIKKLNSVCFEFPLIKTLISSANVTSNTLFNILDKFFNKIEP
ncbi:3' exoribonuclease family protein, putative [Cryptosporidium muris RN66]|uniref:Ribosomal RNA-processing protein 42 n=1 Tax=Cryptosporidium muris (strain RN66) TaxID=441375 RepID=B6AAL9_CRYMR|nr:3' exoribonuclease family protein, putative [Cryptosporidium muris RN66]EEA05421.1 3' exoribonuclease family protein, putative [Cryptosporidium muris RN66]|eukprot:XP_002139770.1 3' exoribonuclease family protein [Cryptosporidium muris RN66]